MTTSTETTDARPPRAIAEQVESVGLAKARLPTLTLMTLSVLAGAFISMGALFFLVVTTQSGLGFGLTRLIGGGVFYTVGAVVYALDRPHLWPGRFSAHDLWHVFVLAGSICHFLLMVLFVAVST